jgi:hypothetical protein
MFLFAAEARLVSDKNGVTSVTIATIKFDSFFIFSFSP